VVERFVCNSVGQVKEAEKETPVEIFGSGLFKSEFTCVVHTMVSHRLVTLLGPPLPTFFHPDSRSLHGIHNRSLTSLFVVRNNGTTNPCPTAFIIVTIYLKESIMIRYGFLSFVSLSCLRRLTKYIFASLNCTVLQKHNFNCNF